MNILYRIRYAIGLLFFLTWLFISYPLIFILFPFFQTRFYDWIGRFVVLKIHFFILRWGFGIRIKTRYFDHIPKDKPVILALKHHTWLETFAIWYYLSGTIIFHRPKILLIGGYLDYIQPFLLGRKAALMMVRTAIRRAQDYINKNPKRWNKVIIFPEGTRRLITDTPKYNIGGLYFMYKTFKYPIYPIAVNTGYFWPKNKSLPVHSGCAVMECLKPIQALDLTKDALEQQLVADLEFATNALVKEAQEA